MLFGGRVALCGGVPRGSGRAGVCNAEDCG